MANDALTAILGLRSNSPTPSYTPDLRRNNAKVGMLKKFLGIEDDSGASQYDLEQTYEGLLDQQMRQAEAEAAAKAVPERLKGEYGLATERLRGQSVVEAARMRAEAAAAERASGREFTAGQNELNRNAIAERNQFTQGQISQRTGQMEQGRYGRQRAGQAEGRAKLLMSGKENAPRPADEGFLSRWLFGPSQETLNEQEANRLRSQALNDISAGDSGVEEIASQYLDVPDAQLESVVMAEQPDATPQELQALIGAVRALRGR